MARNRISLQAGSSRDARGFTLLEILVVVAILGVLAVMAFPSVQRFSRAQETKEGATKLAGVLEDARSRAVSEATPHLVYVNDPGVGDGGEGCGPLAVIVRDSDRSYSITDGDKLREFKLPGKTCKDVKLYAQDDTAEPYEDLRLPAEDQSILSGTLSALTEPVSGQLGSEGDDEGEEDDSGEGSTSAPSVRSEQVKDAVVNGSTFPVDAASGRPMIAFSERGIPVDPARPTSWGSGAGAIYLTDGSEAVYAAVVQPMGGIRLRKYEPATGDWR